MKKVEIVLLESEEEYRQEYIANYVNRKFSLGDIPVIFSERDFNHIFFESAKEGNGHIFSKRRAKRMYFMKEILSGEINTEVMHELDRGTIALFCLDLESVVYLRIRPKNKTLQVGTFFDFGKDHTKMYLKQKKKCEPITLSEIKEKLLN